MRATAHSNRIEILESRIAPALLVNGANLLGGAGNPNSADTSIGGNAVTLVKVLSGQALVWFQDGVITGISFGPNANIQVTGNVEGDIVGNLTAQGRLSDSDGDASNGDDGNLLLNNKLIGLKTSILGDQDGDVHAIISGGSVSNINISGQLEGIYAGDGAFRSESEIATAKMVDSEIGFDTNPVQPGTQSTFTFNGDPLQVNGVTQLGRLQPTASITNVLVETAHQLQIFSGSGGLGLTPTKAGLPGGNVEKVSIKSAFNETSGISLPSYHIIAGDGGDGASGTVGGKGGAILQIFEKASKGAATLTAGNGGNGNGKVGGAGGNIDGLELQSDTTNYTVTSGNGGDGVGGGNGGNTTNSNFANRTPVNSIVVSGNFTPGDLNDFDDIIFIDSSTGELVVSHNLNNGTDFQLIVQSVDNSNPLDPQDVYTLAAAGTTPVDAVAVDIDNDGKLDIGVIYKNTNNVAFFINDGNGNFYDEILETPDQITATLGFSPSLIAKNTLSTYSNFAIVGDVAGKSSVYELHQESFGVFSVSTLNTAVGKQITDLVTTSQDLFASAQDGSIIRLDAKSDPNQKPYDAIIDPTTISGGINNLSVDRLGNRLLAFSSSGKSVTAFTVTPSGPLTPLAAIDLSARAGKPILARFIEQPATGSADLIGVLSSLSNGSRFDTYTPSVLNLVTTYNFSQSLSSQPILKNFVSVDDGSGTGIAFVGGSLSQFHFSTDLTDFTTYGLPFEGKRVTVTSGNGGDSSDTLTVFGHGGNGGNIIGINAEANDITLVAGTGGDSVIGGAGNGGSVVNSASFNSGGATIKPALFADSSISITVGAAGTAAGNLTGTAKTSTGGDGGSMSGLTMTLITGTVTLKTGDGGDGKGGKAGNAGSVSGVNIIAQDGNLVITTGEGGDASANVVAGGNGGNVSNLKFTLDLAPEIEVNESGYSVSITTGDGGDSTAGQAGSGGNLDSLSLVLDGSDSTDPFVADANKDSTIITSLLAGNGGNGAIGGQGGSILNLSSLSVLDQKTSTGAIVDNYFVLSATAGNGGNGTAGNGGNGGKLTFGADGISGISYYDEDSLVQDIPLILAAGKGGNGSLKGGQGGDVSNLVARNAKFIDGASITGTQLGGADIKAGDGGDGGTMDGGKGGTISKLVVGASFGYVATEAGDGGDSTSGKGGAGGLVTTSTLASTNSSLYIFGGDGGNGFKGAGLGGSLTTLTISTPQSTLTEALLIAGDGGNAIGAAAAGGSGGNITSITQSKDINAVISLIQAGNGGNSTSGVAGKGGNVSTIKSVGFIGLPSDSTVKLGAFNGANAQGIFSGRHGTGLSGITDAANGSVTSVTARQIAAIAAAVDTNGLFALASKVSGIKADLIGYDIDGDGAYDDVNNANDLTTPSAVKAKDGFILAAVISSITTASPRLNFRFTA